MRGSRKRRQGSRPGLKRSDSSPSSTRFAAKPVSQSSPPPGEEGVLAAGNRTRPKDPKPFSLAPPATRGHKTKEIPARRPALIIGGILAAEGRLPVTAMDESGERRPRRVQKTPARGQTLAGEGPYHFLSEAPSAPPGRASILPAIASASGPRPPAPSAARNHRRSSAGHCSGASSLKVEHPGYHSSKEPEATLDAAGTPSGDAFSAIWPSAVTVSSPSWLSVI
jgi:hypothetical protein